MTPVAARDALLNDVVDAFKSEGKIVIVGASLAGLRAAEALRDEGFNGSLTIIGDEPHEPYDRPPLSKQVLTGWVRADHTKLPRMRDIDADWRLGVAAVGLDRTNRRVHLADGDTVPFGRMLIATGTRARPWFNPEEAKLEGVFTLRTSDDAARLQAALLAGPGRVLIIGAGFIGSEMASVCRELGLNVTVAEHADSPLIGALGGVIGEIAAEMQRDAGVDLRTGVGVDALEGDAAGHVRRAQLSDGTTLDVDVVVCSLGSIRNTEWLEGARLATGFWGVACDAGCRAFDINGVVTDNIFVAGDIARAPHVLYGYQFLSMEHWDNAVSGGQGGRQEHGPDRDRARAAPPAAVLLVGPVRREYQRRRGVPLRRGDRLHPGLGEGAPLRCRLWPQRPHRGSRHLQPRQVVGVLRRIDRAIGAVPAAATGLRPACAHGAGPCSVPLSARPDGNSRCGVDRLRPDRTRGRVRIPAEEPENLERRHDAVMTPETAWAEAMRYENRANPFPFFDELRKTPVARVGDDLYVVTGYWELHKLLHDPRLSSDGNRSPVAIRTVASGTGRRRRHRGLRPEAELHLDRPAGPRPHAPPGDAAIRSSALTGPHPEHGARHSAAL